MKSTVNPVKQVKFVHTFPALYENYGSGLIVLATSRNAGTVVRGDKNYELGHYADNWQKFDDENSWTRLTNGSSITLTQE